MTHHTHHEETASVRPSTLAWASGQLEPGERIVGAETLLGGITAEMRRLTVSAPDGSTRHLVLRSFVDPYYRTFAEEWLDREAGALTLLPGTDVRAPALLAADPTATHCEFPSLLMTHLPGRMVLVDEGLEVRVPLLARQLVAIHGVRPARRPREYVTLTTPDTVVTPEAADKAVWSAAVDVIRRPRPPYEGRFLHRDFQPGNVLFDVPPQRPTAARITGVVDWAGTSWGPADLDVAHCATILALLHGPVWGLRFTEAYEEAGGALAASPGDRLYWQVRDALAASEELGVVAGAWRAAGRPELTTRTVEQRLDAYVTALMDVPG